MKSNSDSPITTIPQTSIDLAIKALPSPFNKESYQLLRQGIYEHSDIAVYLNEKKDFAFLYPAPSFDYTHYKPRVKRLALNQYRKRNDVIEKRFDKISTLFSGSLTVLEIGSFDAAFLRRAKEANSTLTLVSLETDLATKADRDQLPWLRQYAQFEEIKTDNLKFDAVCFFHVLEHIADPASFLSLCSQVLAPKGRLVIEVPSMDDPLLSLYGLKEYGEFYFQTQHPYVYTAKSLSRLLEANGWHVEYCIPHQRYGIENHLAWLSKRQPGGDEMLRNLFGSMDSTYRERIESNGLTDAVIAVAVRA